MCPQQISSFCHVCYTCQNAENCQEAAVSDMAASVLYRECFEIKCMDTAPFTGRCITGDSAVSVIVQITDACPECAADHIDIQALTFNKLAPMNTGRINIQYR